MPVKPIKRALVSVADKRQLAEFCRALARLDVQILSTGGTARFLIEQGVAVIQVSDYTGFPEILHGRVKTLHPKIHAGLLAPTEDEPDLAELGIAPIDLVVVNLYPFQQRVADPACRRADAIENIDIGGAAMLRAAAKNHQRVSAVVDIADYARVIEQMQTHDGRVDAATRFDLAIKCFKHTAEYDTAVADYLSAEFAASQTATPRAAAAAANPFPPRLNLQLHKKLDLRYGENPHQAAALYTAADPAAPATLADSRPLQGKALSYNNLADADAALACVRQFDAAACVIVKHTNPCGVAQRDTQLHAYQSAYQTDTESAFGGVIAFNQCLQADTAAQIVQNPLVELLIAPSVDAAALDVLAAKPNLSVLSIDFTAPGAASNTPSNTTSNATSNTTSNTWHYKSLNGGWLVQQADTELYQNLDVVTRRQPSTREMQDLLFAYKVAKYVKSNAIVYARNLATIGVGAGQMSRVNAARIAAHKAAQASLELTGSVMASDAFFPFRDSLDNAAAVGIRAVIQPGGSKRDPAVIQAADAHDLAMVFTARRHFWH